MISEFFLNILFGIVSGMLEILPDVSWSVETSAFEYMLSIIQCVGYFLPWNHVVTIVGLIVDFAIIRIGISLITTLWEMLPGM